MLTFTLTNVAWARYPLGPVTRMSELSSVETLTAVLSAYVTLKAFDAAPAPVTPPDELYVAVGASAVFT